MFERCDVTFESQGLRCAGLVLRTERYQIAGAATSHRDGAWLQCSEGNVPRQLRGTIRGGRMSEGG